MLHGVYLRHIYLLRNPHGTRIILETVLLATTTPCDEITIYACQARWGVCVWQRARLYITWAVTHPSTDWTQRCLT